MPPQQPVLASSLRGYVCTSCMFNLRSSKQLQPSWLLRNATTSSRRRPRPSIIFNRQQKPGDPTIKYFDQLPGGRRKEKEGIFGDDEALLARIESEINALEQELGGDPRSDEEREAEEKRWLEGEGEDDDVEADIEAQISKQMNLPSDTDPKLAAMVAQMEKYKNGPGLDYLTEEQRLELRNELLSGIPGYDTEEVPPSPEQASQETNTYIHQATRGSTTASLSAITISSEKFPGVYRRVIDRLNTSLHFASSLLNQNKLDHAVQKEAWKSYMRCRLALESAPHEVPPKVWTSLWDVFEYPCTKNYNRLEHLYVLGKDMTFANVALDGSRLLLYIESLVLKNQHGSAIETWEKAEQSVGRDKEMSTFKEYWELGVRMHSHFGDVEKALETVSIYLSKAQERTAFRLLIPVIREFSSLGTEDNKNRAWRAYEQMKLNLGSDMTMEDFDQVTCIFLDAGLHERALDVFKDMMLEAESRDKAPATLLLEGEEPATLLLKGEEPITTTTSQDIVQIVRTGTDFDTSRLAELPSYFNNKIFFGKWVKKLIGEGALNGAKTVLDLMPARGIRPDARYMNGIIGALFRSGPGGQQQEAEIMAWKMISARIKYVEARTLISQYKYTLDEKLRIVLSTGNPDFKSLYYTPRGTLETFCVLLAQYKLRQKTSNVLDLLKALREAKIKPTAYFMNQLMTLPVMQGTNQTPWSWDTYLEFSRADKVRPDYYTFTILWDLMRRGLQPNVKNPITPFTSPRLLFSEMITHKDVLCSNQASMPRPVYDLIILSFALSNDQTGTAVALRALQQRFNLYPRQSTIRTVVMQLAHFGHKTKEGRTGRLQEFRRRTEQKRRIAEVTNLLHTIHQRRVENLLKQGIVFEDLKEDARLEESLLLLMDVLRFLAQTRLDAGYYEGMSLQSLGQKAAEDMGVEDCNPWQDSKDLENAESMGALHDLMRSFKNIDDPAEDIGVSCTESDEPTGEADGIVSEEGTR